MITSQAVPLDTAVLQFINVIVEVSILLLEDRLGYASWSSDRSYCNAF